MGGGRCLPWNSIPSGGVTTLLVVQAYDSLSYLVRLYSQKKEAKNSYTFCLFYIKIFHGLKTKGPGKRGHIVADTLLPMMFLGLRKLGNICCGHKMFLNKIKDFLCPGHKICVCNKCCVRGQTGKHLCRQQCVRNNNNVSSFARALTVSSFFIIGILTEIVIETATETGK